MKFATFQDTSDKLPVNKRANARQAPPKNVRRPPASKPEQKKERVNVFSQRKGVDDKSKGAQPKSSTLPTDGKSQSQQTPAVDDEPQNRKDKRAATPQKSSVKIGDGYQTPPSRIAPVASERKSALKNTPASVSRPRKTPASSRKRQAPEEDLVTDDDSFTLGCTPSGKVRRAENGKPLPVIRKSFEIRKLKTTEVSAAGLMCS